MSIKRTSYLVNRLKLQSLHEAVVQGNLLVEEYALKRLLFEEFTGDEEKELSASLKNVDDILMKLGQQSKSKEFVKLVIDPILKADAKIPRDASDQAAVADFSRAVQDIAEEAAKVISVLEAMQTDIKKLIEEQAPDADPKKTIAEILDEADFEVGDGLEKAYVTPEWFTKAWGAGAKEAEKEAEGMFGKVKGFFKSLFGKGKSTVKVKPANIQKGLLSIPLGSLDAINVEAAKKQLIGTTKEVSGGATDLTGSAMAGGEEGKEGEAEGASEKEVEAVEKVSVDFKDLIALLAKQDPEAAQEKIEAAADEAGVEPDELKQIVQDPEAVDEMAEEDEEVDPEAIEQAMADAAAEMEEEGVAEEEISDEAAEELDPADEIEAAEDESNPKAGLASMFDDWKGGISKSAQGALDAKNRGEDLKTGMTSAVDSVEGDVSDAIKQAIAGWRAENEDELVKTNKFTSDNFQSLEDLVPDLATNVLKKANENRFVMTRSYINRYVHRVLDIMAGDIHLGPDVSRLNELAGIADRPFLAEQSFDDEAKEKVDKVLDKAAAEVAMEFEADEEQAEKDLEAPAKEMGGSVDGADLALGLKYADEGEKDELYDVLEDGEADPDKVVDVLKSLPKELQEDDPEDDPGEVESIVDKAVSAAADPEEDEEAVQNALTTAIDNWEDSLSDRQKKRVNAKNRLGDLKKGVEDATPPQVDDPVDPADVKAVGDDWADKNKIDDPKSPLGNPKNFSPEQMKKLIDLFPEIVDEVQGEEGEEDEGSEELTSAAEELLDKYEEFEEENPEAAEEALEEPAKELGIDPAKLVDLLDNPEDLEAAAEEEEVEPEELAGALETATEEVAEVGDEEGEGAEEAADALLAAYEEMAKEDEEGALEALEEPAEEIGVPPEELVDILDNPEELQDAAKEEEIEIATLTSTLEDAAEDVEAAAEEGGEEEVDAEASDPSDELEAEMDSSGPIKGAIATALDGWRDSLEGEAGEVIGDRYPSLKDAIFGAIDNSGDELSTAVSDEIAAWRSEHEETLVKSKKFAKKNFQSLEDLAPDMAAAILKKSNEAVGTLTRNTVRKAVHGYLDKRYYGESDLLQERFIRRMNKLAGLL